MCAVERGGHRPRPRQPARLLITAAFIPLFAYPEGDVPTIQPRPSKQLIRPSTWRLAERRLRTRASFIIGSGMTYHNMRGFRDPRRRRPKSFDAWLRERRCSSRRASETSGSELGQGPGRARQAHPREEHLIPLLVAAGQPP